MANQPKKYKKFVATAATATLVASAIVPVASAASLSDIKGNTHEEAITSLVDAGVINGYPDGTFQPNKTLTRSDVVKLLGKYLVSKGLEVPADYKTNVRFNDLTSASNDELLKYAAVVYDAGVFNGSNGNLLAGDNITRENMAVVLVRAFDTLNNIDLVSYVQGQEYKKDVKDLYTAKSEARSAIEVLDFFDITNPAVANFNPKGSTTRGQFATFLYKTINTDFSSVTGVANSAVSEIKAINNTTVEVTFKDTVDNIESLDFTIEGLEVKNAVVKQTDAKTVVLTTAAQTGDKVYTLNVNAAKAGTFKGISAVIPTAVNVTTGSVQGIIGKEVTVKAEVTVPTGQSKAGIPVTFNITSNSANTDKIEVQSVTNADGVATYTYTRYYASEDTFTAYATDKSSVFSNGKVYWANEIQLAVSEITTGNDLANETKKSYKVTGDANATYYIAIKENLNIAPDKITDVKVQNHGSQNFVTPYELTTGSTSFASVTTNSKGEGSFTVYGSNLSATPIVYAPESTPTTPASNKYNKLDLQAEAPTVKFSQIDRLALTVAGEGTADSAEYYTAPVAYDSNSAGGRTYTVTVTDKDGKVAPAGTVAHVSFDDLAGDVYFSTGKENFVKVAKNDVKQIVVGKEGKAQFRVAGKGATTYVKPTVFLNTAGVVSPAKLDKADVQQVADVTYFKSPVVTNASLKVTDGNGNEITTRTANEDAYFRYQSVDQNGFPYRPGAYTTTPGSTTTIYVQHTDPITGVVTFVPQVVTNNPITSNTYVLAFDVTSTFGNAVVKDANGITLPSVQNVGSTKTYHVNSNASGEALVRVTSQSADTVSVNVTGASNILPTQTASVSFTDSTILPSVYTGNARIDTAKGEITFAKVGGGFFQTVSYANASFTQNGVTISKDKFEQLVSTDQTVSGKYSEVTATRDVNGNYTFDYRATGSSLPTPPPAANNAPVAKTGLDKSLVATAATNELVYTAGDLATDADALDTLTIKGAISSNTAVATVVATTSGITVDAKGTGSSTITVVVTDGKADINVTFKVDVTTGVVSAVSPTVAYVPTSDATSASYKSKAITSSLTKDINVTIDSVTKTVTTSGLSSATDVAAAINTAFGGVTTFATVSGDQVVITSTTTGTTSKVVVDEAAASAGTDTELPILTVNGKAAVTTATKAEFTFSVTAVPAEGEKVVVAGKTYTLPLVASETASAYATRLAAAIAADTTNEFTATASSGTITLVQRDAAPTTTPVVKVVK